MHEMKGLHKGFKSVRKVFIDIYDNLYAFQKFYRFYIHSLIKVRTHAQKTYSEINNIN